MLKFLSTVREEEHEKKSQDAAANGQRAPQQALHRRRHSTVWSGMSGRNSVLDPEDYVSAIVNFFFAPSGKSQQRLIEGSWTKMYFSPYWSVCFNMARRAS